MQLEANCVSSVSTAAEFRQSSNNPFNWFARRMVDMKFKLDLIGWRILSAEYSAVRNI